MLITLKPGWAPQTIAATGQTCSPGEVIDVPADLGASLCEQTDKWSKAKKTVEGTNTPKGEKKDGEV